MLFVGGNLSEVAGFEVADAEGDRVGSVEVGPPGFGDGRDGDDGFGGLGLGAGADRFGEYNRMALAGLERRRHPELSTAGQKPVGDTVVHRPPGQWGRM